MDDVQGVVERGRYKKGEYAEELAIALSNRDLGTKLWFENDRIRVWEVRLDPGDRGAFHAHTTNYFWTVVEGGRGLQRYDDGAYMIKDYAVGETRYLEHTEDTPLVHDLENVGNTTLRFVTVEILG